tara:strand:- start:421 stop:693 length:273 start_codon:yes stop_codon:yes gene_type:complete
MKNKKMKIWAMTEGPFHYTDLPPEDIAEYPYMDELEWFAVCKVEVDGKLIDHEFFFETLEQVYQWKNYFNNHMEALEIDMNDSNFLGKLI